MRFFIVFSTVIAPLLSATLVPMPREIDLGEGKLVVDVQTAVIAPDDLAPQAEVLTAAL
jgi:hypothetical protein